MRINKVAVTPFVLVQQPAGYLYTDKKFTNPV